MRGRSSSRISPRRCWPDRISRSSSKPRSVRRSKSEPGVAMRAFGPGPARPVIRGLDGDRVAVLQDGQRVGDLSSQSGDHGVTVNPSSATADRSRARTSHAAVRRQCDWRTGQRDHRSDSDRTPWFGATASSRSILGQTLARPVAPAMSTSARAGFAMHVAGGGRRNGDFSTPEGEVENSQSRSSVFNIGGSWTSDKRYLGASYGFDNSKYGVPIVEEGQISLNPERHAFTIRAGGNGLGGAIPSYRATLGIRRYQHDELDRRRSGHALRQRHRGGRTDAVARPYGRLSGTIGGSFLNRAFNAIGEEALAPRSISSGGALFLYEELTWPHVTVQFGGRVDRTASSPTATPAESDFTECSGSPASCCGRRATNDGFVIALSLAHAARNPALEELYYFGPHPGNFAFEIGNPEVDSRARARDSTSRCEPVPAASRGEVTFFRNDISRFHLPKSVERGGGFVADARIQRTVRHERTD